MTYTQTDMTEGKIGYPLIIPPNIFTEKWYILIVLYNKKKGILML